MNNVGLLDGWIQSKVCCVLTGYRLTVIEDEQVPLAAKAGTNLPGLILILAVVFFLLYVALAYLWACRRYQKRILDLKGDSSVYCGWNKPKLREQLMELEAKLLIM